MMYEMRDEKTRRILRWLVIVFCVLAILFVALLVYYFPIKDRLPAEVQNYSDQILISHENVSDNMEKLQVSIGEIDESRM